MFSRKRSILYAWVLSYLAVFLIPVIVSVALYPLSNNILQKEIFNANTSLLRQAQSAIDDRLDDIRKLSAEISMNPLVRGLPYLHDPADEALQFNQVIQYLRGYKTTNSFLDNIYLYMGGKGGAISYNTYLPADILWKRLSHYQPLSEQQWQNVVEGKYRPEFVPICSSNDAASECGAVAFLNSLPMDNAEGVFGNLFFLISTSNFLEPVQNLQWVDGGHVVLLDERNRVLASTTKEPMGLVYGDLQATEGNLHMKHNGQSMTVSYTTSTITNWKYVSVIPTKAIREKSDYVRNLTLSGLLLSLLLGGGLTFFLIRKQYNPLKSLISGIGKFEGLMFDRKINEFEFIQRAIQHSYREKEAIAQVVKQQKSLLKSNDLTRWLKGQLDAPKLLEEMFSAYGIRFASECFWVMVFYVDEKALIASDSTYKDEVKLARFIISNTALEVLSEQFEVIATEVDDRITFIINGQELHGERERENFVQIEKKLRTFIGTNYRIPFKSSVSQAKKDVHDIPEAYKEAVDAIEYHLILGINEMAFYQTVSSENKKTSEWDYYSTIRAEKKLINLIKSGDRIKSREMLSEIFEINNSSSPLSVSEAKFLMLQLINTLFKTLYENNLHMDESFLEQLNPIRRMLGCSTIPDIRRTMGDILDQLCEYIQLHKKDEARNELIDAVRAFIEENYGDANLNVSMLGSRFMMTSDYLSRLFKEQTGIGLLDYLNRCRLEKAKILLQNERFSINDISTQVGFVNSNGFIRTFKKYEGVTPGKFRGTGFANKEDG